MTRLTLLTALAAAVCAALGSAAVSAASGRPKWRLRRASDAKSRQHLPRVFLTGPRTCTPHLPDDVLAQLPPEQRTTVEVFGEGFDPAAWDEISVAGDGRWLAYATSVSEAGAPGTTEEVVIVSGVRGEAPVRVPKVGASDDQPSVQIDDLGMRCAFRSAAGADGAGVSNVQLFSFTRLGAEPETGTAAITASGAGEAAFDPALAARTRTREVGGGIKVKERDARVAFVSTSNPAGENPEHAEQLFLWEEQGNVTRQLTRHGDPDARVSRPTIAKSGDLIVFESTADLTPEAVDPLDSGRVGNPDGVRQLFRWRRGAGIDQITWSDGDCYAPRMDASGRVVLFSSRGDPIRGANPDRNLEIFQWTPRAAPSARLRQLTQTENGDNVLPRPSARRGVFVFFSTVVPPVRDPGDPGGGSYEFGEGGLRECTPQALVYERGRVRHVHGYLDIENALRAVETPSKLPVVTGPPAAGVRGDKAFFVTNDFRFNPRPEPGEEPDRSTQLVFGDVAVAQRR